MCFLEIFSIKISMNIYTIISYQYINFQVPPGNNIDSDYKLRVEGGHQAGHGGGAIVFENETKLEFSEQFLSVSIRYLLLISISFPSYSYK